MKLRKHIFPRRWCDILCFLLIALFLPPIALFDLVIVVPATHSPGEFMHNFIFTLGVFLFTNIYGNMFATMMVDTSVDGKYNNVLFSVTKKLFNSSQLFIAIDLDSVTPLNPRAKGWYTCKHCLRLVPPRSYHCKGK